MLCGLIRIVSPPSFTKLCRLRGADTRTAGVPNRMTPARALFPHGTQGDLQISASRESGSGSGPVPSDRTTAEPRLFSVEGRGASLRSWAEPSDSSGAG